MPKERNRSSAFFQTKELFALKAIDTGSEWLIPVVGCAVRVAGHAPGVGIAIGGSGASRFVGAWIERPDAPSAWLPADPNPPDGSADWSAWLLASDDLLEEIYQRIHAARSPKPSAAVT